MSLYGDYIKERENFEIIEDNHWFATYQMTDDGTTLYIRDCFIEKGHRGQGVVEGIDNTLIEIAKVNGCKNILTQVALFDPHKDRNMRCFLRIGYRIISANSEVIYIGKEV